MTILFYKSEAGRSPVEKFLADIPDGARAELGAKIRQLHEEGTEMCLNPKWLEYAPAHKLYELKATHASIRYRILLAIQGTEACLLHGFIKKTPQVLLKEFELAKSRLAYHNTVRFSIKKPLT